QKSPELRLGALLSPWERLRRLMSAGSPPPAEGLPLAPSVGAFRSRLTVEPVPNSPLVNLRFRAYDPGLAARVGNTPAQLYIEQSLEFRYTTSAEATGWLADRVQEQQRKVEAAERALQQYREAEGVLSLEERQSLVDQRLSALSAAVVTARTERIAKEAV